MSPLTGNIRNRQIHRDRMQVTHRRTVAQPYNEWQDYSATKGNEALMHDDLESATREKPATRGQMYESAYEEYPERATSHDRKLKSGLAAEKGGWEMGTEFAFAATKK